MNEKSITVRTHDGKSWTFREATSWIVDSDNQLDLRAGETEDELKIVASFSGPSWMAVYMSDALGTADAVAEQPS